MRETTRHFHDSADPDAKGQVAWVYDGDDIPLEEHGHHVTFRRYTDEPTRAYTHTSWAALARAPVAFLALAFRHLRTTYAVTEVYARHPERGYAPLDAALASAVATEALTPQRERELLAA